MPTLCIREVAESKGITKAKLARLADLGTTTVNELWSGTRTNVQLDTLAIIARVLGVGVKDLILEDNESGNNLVLGAEVELAYA